MNSNKKTSHTTNDTNQCWHPYQSNDLFIDLSLMSSLPSIPIKLEESEKERHDRVEFDLTQNV